MPYKIAFAAALLMVSAATLPSATKGLVQVPGGDVQLLRTPDGGIQPQLAVDATGDLHLLFFKGAPGNGDLFYSRRKAGARGFSVPLRVNSELGSAIATGTVRGGHLAIGRDGRVHVAWMGSSDAKPRAADGATPMLYARLDASADAFTPQRNVLQFATGLDGGGTVAADQSGNVYVAWHAGGPESTDESTRRVWVSRSIDDGQTFARETAASSRSIGACGCCGMRALAHNGTLSILFRSATALTHRDTYLLTSTDRGATFAAAKWHEWNVAACQMSTYALAPNGPGIVAAWETEGQVYWVSRQPNGSQTAVITPAGPSGARKHPSLAVNARGEVLLVWTEGTGWNKGGALAWQRFDQQGRPVGARGTASGVATWSLGATAATKDGRFVIVY